MTAASVPRQKRAPKSWREVGICRDSDPNFFYPVGRGQAALEQTEAAKSVCRVCPSREPCLAFALATHQKLGIWGGASPKERRQLARGRPRPVGLPRTDATAESSGDKRLSEAS